MGSQYRVLTGAPCFMVAFRDAVQAATRRCWVQFSTFEGDASGVAVTELLVDAARRGLDVRLILDYYSDVVVSDVWPLAVHRHREVHAEKERTRALLRELAGAGVAILRTAPVGFIWRFILFRDHKKIVLADDVAFVGGINVSDHNFAWHDFMVRIEGGPVVEQLSADFGSTFDGATVALDYPGPGADFVLNQCAGRPSVLAEIVRMIDGAERSLVVQSPYLLGDRVEPAIRRAADRGVDVTLILPGHANRGIYRVWLRHLQRRLVHENIVVFGFEGAHRMTHAKLVVVDGERATFGSLNMLELEGLTQKELNVFTRDPDCLAQLEKLVAADIAESRVMEPPRTSFGRFTYTWLYDSFDWWTRRLLTDPAWVRRYC